MDQFTDTTAALLGLIAVATAVLSWAKWARPKLKARESDRVAQRDALIGRDAIFDSITKKELVPALPGIGQRMANTEATVSEMSKAVAQLAETHAQMVNFQETLTDHDHRLVALEAASIERVVTRAESAAGWRAMEEAIKAKPDVVEVPLEP